MISAGLLWYDDDLRRPLAVKLAEASERYRERVGYEPTTCLLNPAQIPAAPPTSGRGSRKKANVPAITLNLVSDEHLRPNYFFVGVGADERPRRVRGWRGNPADAQPETVPTRRVRQPSVKPASGTQAAKPAASANPATSAKPVVSTAPAASTKPVAAARSKTAANVARAVPVPEASRQASAPAAAPKRRGLRKAADTKRVATPSAPHAIAEAKPAAPARPRAASTIATGKPAKAQEASSVTAVKAASPAAGARGRIMRTAEHRARSGGDADGAGARRVRTSEPTTKPAKAPASSSATLAPQRRRRSA